MNITGSGTSFRTLNALIARAADRSNVAVLVTDEQAVALYQRWNTALAARLDYVLEFAGSRSAEDAAAGAWFELERDTPVLRALLDDNLLRPAVEAAVHRERQLMALAAGLVELNAPPRRVSVVGQRYLDGIRHRDLADNLDPAKIA
jgi:hypothetical protein